MICPNCGNELGQDEVFCGQCGSQTVPSFKPTEMVQTPPGQSGLLNGGYATQPISGASYMPGAQPPVNPTGALPPNANQPVIIPSGPQQQGGFYQDATESISALPPGQSYPAAYPPQGYPAAPVQGGYPPSSTQYGQPLQSGNYAGPQYPPTYPPGGGYRPGPTPPPKQRGSAVLIIAIICLALAVISFGAFGILYFVHGKNNPTVLSTPSPAITVTTIPSPSPTPSPSPSPTPTQTPSPTPTLSPTPSVPPADNGFSFCTDPCAARGFIIEVPQGWLQSAPDTATVIFNSPTQNDVYSLVRTPGPASQSANNLVAADLATYYPGNTVTATYANRTIGGENWSYEVATRQVSGVTEQVEVFATVHNNNAYIIELQAPQPQYASIDAADFENMLNRYQFQP